MHRLAHIMLLVAGIIHLLPLAGLAGPVHLERLYGVVITEPNLIILMRHRAVLLALIGMLLAAAAFRSKLRTAAYLAGLASMVSFLALAWSADAYNPLLARVVAADLAASACLLIALAAELRRHWKRG